MGLWRSNFKGGRDPHNTSPPLITNPPPTHIQLLICSIPYAVKPVSEESMISPLSLPFTCSGGILLFTPRLAKVDCR